MLTYHFYSILAKSKIDNRFFTWVCSTNSSIKFLIFVLQAKFAVVFIKHFFECGDFGLRKHKRLGQPQGI
jgi:hypothetical protein